jgi:hypothetical protein
MLEKLVRFEGRFDELTRMLSDPDVLSDQDKMRTLSKEHSFLDGVVNAGAQLRRVTEEIAGNKELIAGDDAELADLAKQELSGLEQRRQQLEGDLKILMLPKDPKAGLIHFNAQADKFLKLNSTAWFGDSYDIIDTTKDLPATKLTDDFRSQLEDAVKNAERLEATAATDAKRLLAALAEVDCRREAQAQVNAKIQDEEEKRLEEEQAVGLQSQRTGTRRPRRSPARSENGRAAHAV